MPSERWKWQSAYIFFFFSHFSMKIKMALPQFPHRSELGVAFFAGSTDDQWTWQVILVRNRSDFGAQSSPNRRNTRATPIWGLADEEREKKRAKLSLFRPGTETLNHISLSLLVQVPREPWIFCKTLLTTIGHNSEYWIKLSRVRPGTRRAPKRPETYMQLNICWAAGLLAGLFGADWSLRLQASWLMSGITRYGFQKLEFSYFCFCMAFFALWHEMTAPVAAWQKNPKDGDSKNKAMCCCTWRQMNVSFPVFGCTPQKKRAWRF